MRTARRFILGAMFLTMAMIVTMCAGLLNQPDPLPCVTQVSSNNLTVKGSPVTKEQIRNALVIVQVAGAHDLPLEAAQIAIATAIQESGLRNLPYGYPGSTSLGLFQQIADWGPRSVRMNPEKSVSMFYFGGRGGQPGLTDIKDWQDKSLAEAAQAVQGSGFPDAYAAHEREAADIVASLGSGNLDASSCEQKDPIETVVQAALGFVGHPYRWSDTDGSGLVAASYLEAGIDLPSDFGALFRFKGNKSAGVSIDEVDPTKFEDNGRRGDMVFISTDGDKTPDQVVIYTGRAAEIESFTIASWNLLGASHSDGGNKAGLPDSDVRMNRALPLLKSFDVAGLQEFEPKQRRLFLTATDGQFGIYPTQAEYGADRPSINSIVWNQQRFELVDGTTRSFRYFNGNVNAIPVVRLRDRDTGSEFYVSNTHDPANTGRYHGQEQYRIYDAQQVHVPYFNKLAKEGLPIFFTGDMNSAFTARGPDPAARRDRQKYLPYCIVTAQTTLRNAYDVNLSRSGVCPTSQQGLPIDHVYVSPGVRVAGWKLESPDAFASDHKAVVATVAVGTPNRSNQLRFAGVGYKSGNAALRQFSQSQIIAVRRVAVTQASSGGTWVPPVKKGIYHLTSSFGECSSLWSSCHTGQDFAAPTGTPIFAMTNGEITEAGYAGAYGNRLVQRLGDGTELWYCHQSRFAVTSGPVRTGQIIGYVGATGNVTGPHVHVEVRTPDGKPVDPMPVLREHGAHP